MISMMRLLRVKVMDWLDDFDPLKRDRWLELLGRELEVVGLGDGQAVEVAKRDQGR